MKVINIKQLIASDACKSGIDFVERNGLVGTPVSAIEGEYNWYVAWLQDQLHNRYEKGKLVFRMIQTGMGHQWRYDSKGREIACTLGLNYTRKTKYVDKDCIHVTDSGGLDIKQYYIDGRLVCSFTPDTRTFYRYDNRGNLLEVTNDCGDILNSYKYNDKDQLIEANGIQYRYDESGNRTYIIFSEDRMEVLEYDDEDRLVYRKSASGFEEDYEYDDRGNTIRNSHEYWEYKHNDIGRLTEIWHNGTSILRVK